MGAWTIFDSSKVMNSWYFFVGKSNSLIFVKEQDQNTCDFFELMTEFS